MHKFQAQPCRRNPGNQNRVSDFRGDNIASLYGLESIDRTASRLHPTFPARHFAASVFRPPKRSKFGARETLENIPSPFLRGTPAAWVLVNSLGFCDGWCFSYAVWLSVLVRDGIPITEVVMTEVTWSE